VHFTRNQLRWGHHQDVSKALCCRQALNRSNVDQVTVARLPHLQQPVASSLTDLSYTHCSMELLMQVGSQLLRQRFSPGRKQVKVLRHAWLINVGIDRLRTAHDRVIATAQKF